VRGEKWNKKRKIGQISEDIVLLITVSRVVLDGMEFHRSFLFFLVVILKIIYTFAVRKWNKKRIVLCQKYKINMIQSTHSQIEKEILKNNKGKIIFSSNYANYGTDVAVRHAFSRLCKNGLLIRLSAGIYLYPEIDREIGVIYPSIEKIAKEIAKQEKARIIPTGVFALNALGLSMQVPMRVIFLTDGTPRMINIEGESSIKFKKIAPKYLSFKSKLMSLIVFALREIGENKATSEQLERIKELLQNEKQELITNDINLAPTWVKNIILKLK